MCDACAKLLLCLLNLIVFRDGSRIFFRRGCTRLLLHFYTNKPHSFFFAEYQLYKKTAGQPGGGGAHPLHPPPRSAPGFFDLLVAVRVVRS